LSASSDRRGKSRTIRRAIEAAAQNARRAIERVARDTLESYLANEERQEAIERLLLRFGEAVKAIPDDVLWSIDAGAPWQKAARFRDLAAHWYEGSLDHELIWNVLKRDLPPMLHALETFLAANPESE